MTDDIRQRHRRQKGEQDCLWCDTQWPCDAIRMADERDEARDISAELARRLDAEITAHDAARADAERLAEALRDVLMSHGYDISDNAAHAINEDAQAALAAHEERVR